MEQDVEGFIISFLEFDFNQKVRHSLVTDQIKQLYGVNYIREIA